MASRSDTARITTKPNRAKGSCSASAKSTEQSAEGEARRKLNSMPVGPFVGQTPPFLIGTHHKLNMCSENAPARFCSCRHRWPEAVAKLQSDLQWRISRQVALCAQCPQSADHISRRGNFNTSSRGRSVWRLPCTLDSDQ